MKKFFAMFLEILASTMGAAYYGINYTAAYITNPGSKYPPGEFSGEKKVLKEQFILTDGAGAGLNANDEIEVGKLPPNCFVTNAKVHINKSLGATGIFSLGNRATVDELGNTVAQDADSLVASADGGGQAALAECSATSALLYKRLKNETSLYLLCTEVMDDSVIDAVVTVEVEYINK